MDLNKLEQISGDEWQMPQRGGMRVPGIIFGNEELLRDMDEKVCEQLANVAALPGIAKAAYAMPDAHWGYGFPVGGVAAFDPDDGGVSAGGVGFDISCGVRTLLTNLKAAAINEVKQALADELFVGIPAGVGSKGRIRLTRAEMDGMLTDGAAWAVRQSYGEAADLVRTEEGGRTEGACPEYVSEHAKTRQQAEMGTLGSGNHYLEVQEVAQIHDPATAAVFGLSQGDVVVTIHCGSRGLGHQIGTDYLRDMLAAAEQHGLDIPDRELACAPIRSDLGQRYIGAMRAGINCALANRQILTHLTRQIFARFFPTARLTLLYDVSHNTCKVETHAVDGAPCAVHVHRKGATRALGAGSTALPSALREVGQPVLIGGSMGTASYVLVGMPTSERHAFGSSCHRAGRRMSRHQARKRWKGRALVDQLRGKGILIRSKSKWGVAEEAPGAYKDVTQVVGASERAGLARKVAKLKPLICVKG